MNTSAKEKIIVIACSTGGPQALRSIVPQLPEGLDAPIVIIQHMPAGFTQSLALRLDSLSKVNVQEAADGVKLKKGNVYIAPSGYQLRLESKHGSANFKISTDKHISGLAPCADVFIESLVDSSYDSVICCVLTGMGRDATAGIKKLKKSKKTYVITQSESSCVVYGMPYSVDKAGYSNEKVDLERIAQAITKCMEVL